MQEHVELEVSLEIIMERIAQAMFKLSVAKDSEKEESKKQLYELIKLQEEAYKGDRKAVCKILEEEK